MFFNSFILPLFDYGDIIWGDRGNASLTSELQVLQNKAARLILDLPANSSATDALTRLLANENFSADIWNGLDTSLRNAVSLPAFKRDLSKAIFDS